VEYLRRQTTLNLPEEKFAAMLVGRWKSGAPLVLTPDKDDPRLALPDVANDFLYLGACSQKSRPLPPDLDGSRCPVSAHIRKVNPRDQGTDLGPPADTLRRQILRRGIPYGPALPVGEENNASIAGIDRGLLFLCYHSSIVDSFETIIRTWVNSPVGPTPPPGFDILLGRNPECGHDRFATIRIGNKEAEVSASEPFVYATGGGYFFSPSVSAIRHVLAV
jgi:Dyp-type peroxidase family